MEEFEELEREKEKLNEQILHFNVEIIHNDDARYDVTKALTSCKATNNSTGPQGYREMTAASQGKMNAIEALKKAQKEVSQMKGALEGMNGTIDRLIKRGNKRAVEFKTTLSDKDAAILK